MSKKKKRNHFVPVMYFSNFYSEIDNATINAQKNMVTCYRIPDKELFWDKGKNIGCKKLLYNCGEDEYLINEIEYRFSKNIETPTKTLLKNLFEKFYNSKMCDIVLTENEIEGLHKFLICQFFRHPLLMPEMLTLLSKLITENSGIEIGENQKAKNAIKELYLTNISNPDSEFFKNLISDLSENFYTVIAKAKGFNFFTSDVPMCLSTSENSITDLTFYDYDIHLPLNKDFCLILFSKKNTLLIKNGLFIEMENAFDDLLFVSLCTSDIFVADHITNEIIEKIEKMYPKAVKQREKIKELQREAKEKLKM